MGIRNILFTIVYMATIFNPQNTFGDKMAGQQKVVRQGDNICISFRYKPNTDIHILIGRCGINKIINIMGIYLDENHSDKVSPRVTKKSVPFMGSYTDWIGPYIIKSISNDDGSLDEFTGGWHGISGNPTAKTEKVSVKIGEKELLNNIVYEGSVEITATNYVKAYNNATRTGKYVLLEVVKYFVTPFKVKVNVESTALEDVILLKYYGLQTQNKPWNGTVEYGNAILSKYIEASDSGPSKDNIVDTFTLTSANYKYRLTAQIDTSYGLGTFEYLREDRPAIFTTAHGKTYFNLVNGKEKWIKEGDTVGWKGIYVFD